MNLICEPDPIWAKKTADFLLEKDQKSELVTNGKDCQLKIYKNKYNAVIIDIDTENHPGLSVLKFIRLNYPSLKIVLTFKSKERFNEINLSKDDLKKLGVCNYLVKPFTADKLIQSIEGENPFDAWKKVSASPGTKTTAEVSAKDQEFTRI